MKIQTLRHERRRLCEDTDPDTHREGHVRTQTPTNTGKKAM